jgi:hypothetical protein
MNEHSIYSLKSFSSEGTSISKPESSQSKLMPTTITEFKKVLKKGIYCCKYEKCFMYFNEKNELRHHQHLHRQEKLFKCPFNGCYKSFYNTYRLKNHQKIHVLL